MSQHWIFDLDGTLVDSFKYYFLTLEEMLAKEGIPFTETHKREALSEHPAKFLARYLNPDLLPIALDALLELSRSDAKVIETYDEILDSLTHLKDNGAQIAIWTNRPLESAKIIIDSSGLAPLIDIHLSGECVKNPKPDSEGLYQIAKFFKCEPAEIIMVGDHEHDMLAAKNAGASAIRASWHGHWQEDSCALADKQFHCSREFASWLKLSNN